MTTQTPDTAGAGAGGLDQEVDGRSVRSWIVIGLVIAVVTLGFGTWWTYGLDRGTSMQDGGTAMADGETGDGEMGEGEMSGEGMMSPDAPRLPAVFAYHDGESMGETVFHSTS